MLTDSQARAGLMHINAYKIFMRIGQAILEEFTMYKKTETREFYILDTALFILLLCFYTKYLSQLF